MLGEGSGKHAASQARLDVHRLGQCMKGGQHWASSPEMTFLAVVPAAERCLACRQRFSFPFFVL